ncbi:hypothetical protein T08_6344 [Trichinella sp. T8]|nr:hypothetical protein T08_6344 [Trichinella sp. T8]
MENPEFWWYKFGFQEDAQKMNHPGLFSVSNHIEIKAAALLLRSCANDVHPTISISVGSKMPLMSSSGHVSSSSPSHLVPGHHTMFARSVRNG